MTDDLAERLAAIAKEPLQGISRTLHLMTVELDNVQTAARVARDAAETIEDYIKAAIDEATAQGAKAAVLAIADGIQSGLAGARRSEAD